MKNELPAIGAPATRALLSVGITNLELAGETGEQALLELHGVGPKVLSILREALAERGLEMQD
ncbi:DNA-binding protein [Glutamicibacter arilaitensis]|uniref:DNA-binding protein n=1 Tax=Glutamicibacter arilaitensis TaxID=256701 RepID=UPI00384DA8F0